jgi:hypothetical protein
MNGVPDGGVSGPQIALVLDFCRGNDARFVDSIAVFLDRGEFFVGIVSDQ